MLDRDLHRSKSYALAARNYPLALVFGAAVAGVSLGVFAAILFVDSPQRPAIAAGPATAESGTATPAKVEPVRTAETSGLGSPEDRRRSPKCERQTWPYQSRDCLVRAEPRVRVIAPDRIDAATIRAIETPTARASDEKPSPAPTDASPTGSIASLLDPRPTPVTPADPALARTANAAVPLPQPAPLAGTATTTTTETPAVPQPETKSKSMSKSMSKAKPAGSERWRHARDRRRDEAIQARDEAREEVAVDADEPQPVRRWTRREYDVPADDGNGRRRVFVIRRDPIGGIFGGLFGGGWND